MPITRRNGQLWSCEPCRKSKLRCDHATPVCGRCTRRDKQHLCVYHPSPLTRAVIPGKKRSHQIPKPTERSIASDDWSQKKVTSAPGFLGHTSYSDAFRDNDSGLELGGISSPPGVVSVDIERIQRGAQALVMLKHISLYREMLTARYKTWQGWTFGWPVILMILTQTEEMWGSLHHEEADETTQTLLLSRRLFEKQTQPLDVHSDTTWQEFASGSVGRWETIGLLFTFVGLGFDTTPRDSLWKYDDLGDAEHVAATMMAIGELCLQFCESAGIINDIVCSLLLHHSLLVSVVYGDGDHRSWRKLGELSTTLFAFGLHQEPVDVPFFINEGRKRTMVAAYAYDKSLATFLGRPPLISWRYCELLMPLDLSWDEIYAEPVVRQAAINDLTSDGWNKKGCIQNGALARVCLLSSIFREKALELSLGRQTEDLPERVEALSRELYEQYDDLPDFLRWSSIGNFPAKKTPDDRLQILQINLRLDYIYHDFLLYRNLAKRTKTTSDRIISVSLEIMTTLISLVARTIEYQTPRVNAAWSLCNVGIPSAGVLSAELLRQSRLRTLEQSTFSRSDIIQKLSIFASYLETTIRHGEGNYHIAQQGQRAIRRVLDQVLATSALAIPSAFDSTELATREQGLEYSDLLEGIDIEDRGPFLDWLDGTTEFHESWLSGMNWS